MVPSISRQDEQREYWNGRYAEDPALFGETESAFARWCTQSLLREAPGNHLLELGAGYGRDLRFFQQQGLIARGVDCADRAMPTSKLTGVELHCAEVFEFLAKEPNESADIVYSNLFYNMDFTVAEHRRLFAQAARILRDGGLHLYSVRSDRDPWFGKGRKVREDTYDLSPDGSTMHFFSAAYAETLRTGTFTQLAVREVREGGEEFPIRLLYVADQRTPRLHEPRRKA